MDPHLSNWYSTYSVNAHHIQDSILAMSSMMWPISGCVVVVFFDRLGTPGRLTASWPSSVSISQATTPLGQRQYYLSYNKLFVILDLIQVSGLLPNIHAICPIHNQRRGFFTSIFPPLLPVLLLCSARQSSLPKIRSLARKKVVTLARLWQERWLVDAWTQQSHNFFFVYNTNWKHTRGI